MESPEVELAGAEICRNIMGLSGTVHPILMRLEKAGWLESRWENVNPSEAGRPRRRLYKLTPLGHRKTREALEELGVPTWRLAWNF
jgi:DNA-binding PadR family transcriptional regulator